MSGWGSEATEAGKAKADVLPASPRKRTTRQTSRYPAQLVSAHGPQVCLFAAFAEFVSIYGEEMVARFADGLAVRIRNGPSR